MRKTLSLLAALVLCSVLAFAQTRTVKGKITDESGSPIPNASIVIKGTQTATVADADGNFTLNAKTGDVLVISAISYKSLTAKVQDNPFIAIKLSPSDDVMDEVIVTAGGVQAKRVEVGTSTTVVKSEELVAGKSPNIAGGLQGKVAGLQINATGGGVNPSFRVVLRGQRSLTGNNQALLVVDNVIVPNEILGNLNPEDVENIVVLNGGGAAALYGSQASNGAIIITTKKGHKGFTGVTVSHTTMFQKPAFYPKLQEKFGAGGSGYGTDENGDPIWSYLENQSYGPAFDGTYRPLGPPLEDGSQDSSYYAYNPGHLDFWVTGITNQTDFSLQTGDDYSTFYLSGQYAQTQGTTPGDDFNRDRKSVV